MDNFVTKGQMFEYKITIALSNKEMSKLGKAGWECFGCSNSVTNFHVTGMYWKREYYDLDTDGIVEWKSKED